MYPLRNWILLRNSAILLCSLEQQESRKMTGEKSTRSIVASNKTTIKSKQVNMSKMHLWVLGLSLYNSPAPQLDCNIQHASKWPPKIARENRLKLHEDNMRGVHDTLGIKKSAGQALTLALYICPCGTHAQGILWAMLPDASVPTKNSTV